MTTQHHTLAGIGLVCAACLMSPAAAPGADEFGGGSTWSAPPAAEVRGQVIEWLGTQDLPQDKLAEFKDRWPEEDAAPAEERLERLAATLADADPEAAKLVALCSGPNTKVLLPEFDWLLDSETAPLVRNNLRLYYARWLVEEQMYDEAIIFFAGLKPQDVVDPAALLFYQAVANHQIVNTEESQQLAQQLLEREDELPRRYQNLAQLMRQDIEGIKYDSLDHISRRMEDIRRRLDLGRAGEKVIKVEDGVIASLDKLIEELEEQEKKKQQSPGQGGAQSNQPMQDSQIAEQKGEGRVEKKNIGTGTGWGDLPPKEREAALQQIGKQFPAHYREAIEQYFRKLASEEENSP